MTGVMWHVVSGRLAGTWHLQGTSLQGAKPSSRHLAVVPVHKDMGPGRTNTLQDGWGKDGIKEGTVRGIPV